MGKYEKLIARLLSGNHDANFAFDDLLKVLTGVGFALRVKGSHHIFWKEGIEEIINLQPLKGGKAKPYQVKQVRNLLVNHQLIPDQDEKN